MPKSQQREVEVLVRVRNGAGEKVDEARFFLDTDTGTIRAVLGGKTSLVEYVETTIKSNWDYDGL